ncbi:hypothetical protein A5719_21600 [Mycolicibacterium peregrinum]|uniref:hypothetical protein n=1 Tax=Mycolicibacterium peregrinum TaxID=43304 RepID=UPI0007EBD088|nr:hypothetical protein [Mycolicibacterium peregrinum]OBF37414.1 hypothetical protein A5719_21600 [Mycolicibacterium peregrinum]
MLEIAARNSGYDSSRSGIEFRADADPLRARRIVGVMFAKEAGRLPIPPGFAPSSLGDSLSPAGTVPPAS